MNDEQLADSVSSTAETPEAKERTCISLLNRQVRATIVSNVLQKGAIGMGTGVLLAFSVFRRRPFPIYFCTGFGLGLAFEQGNQMIREMNERLRLEAIEAGKRKESPFKLANYKP